MFEDVNCDLVKRLRRGKFCKHALKSHYNFTDKFLNKVSIDIKLHHTATDSKNKIFHVSPVNIDEDSIEALIQSYTNYSNSCDQSKILPLANVPYYNILGFNNDYENENAYEDFDLSVNYTRTITRATVKQSLDAFTKPKGKNSFYLKNVSLRCFYLNASEYAISDRGCQRFFAKNFSQVHCQCEHARALVAAMFSVSFSEVPYAVQVSLLVADIS